LTNIVFEYDTYSQQFDVVDAAFHPFIYVKDEVNSNKQIVGRVMRWVSRLIVLSVLTEYRIADRLKIRFDKLKRDWGVDGEYLGNPKLLKHVESEMPRLD